MTFLTAKEWDEPTLTRILVPLQGFPAEVNSINLAFSLAEHSKAQVSILHCKERFGRTKKTLLTRLAEYAEFLSNRLEVPFDIERVTRVRASDAILKSSHKQDCDLIIMSAAHVATHKHLLGSTARRVARKSKIPVLIVASWINDFKENKKPVIRKILLPIRKTSKDITALRLASSLKKSSTAQKAELIALNLTRLQMVEGPPSKEAPEIRLERELFMDDISIFSEQTGLEIKPKHVATRKIAEAAIDLAAKENIDLIILGPQRKPGRFGEILGSVSQAIASKSNSVVVIPFVPYPLKDE